MEHYVPKHLRDMFDTDDEAGRSKARTALIEWIKVYITKMAIGDTINLPELGHMVKGESELPH